MHQPARRQFLDSTKTAVLAHPPYSPDLASSDFLFPKLKMKIKGRRFETIEDIQTES